MSKLKTVTIFANGNLAAWDEKGKQIPKLQESWINFEALRRLAQRIVKDGATVEGNIPVNHDPLKDYINFYREHGVES